MTELPKVLEAIEIVFKLINGSTWSPSSFTSVTHTLATLSALGKEIDDKIKSGANEEKTETGV
jgi:hypothetical protein